MTLLSFITLVVNWGLAPSGQLDLRSGSGAYEGSSHQPTLRPVAHSLRVCPYAPSLTLSSSFSRPGSWG